MSYNSGDTWKGLSNSHAPHVQILYVGVNDSSLVAGSVDGLFKILPDSSDWAVVPFFEQFYLLSITDNNNKREVFKFIKE